MQATSLTKEKTTEMQVRCPSCGSEAFNKYGRIGSGKQRFVCLVCGRQFIEGAFHVDPDSRPRCRNCGKEMHVYMRNEKYIRFRCVDYPRCRTFEKIMKED